MIRLGSVLSNNVRIKRTLEYFDAGTGPLPFYIDANANSFIQSMASYGATDAWDFTSDQYLRAGVIAPSGLSVTRASSGYAQREDGIWVSFASGVLRRTDKGALIEGSRINRALHSRDLTQAAWTATNVTVARNQVGIDGTANSACSLTATAGNGTVLQAVTNASTARYFSVWIRRITGTGTVEVTLDNGSTWTGVTVTSAYTRVGAGQTLANPTVGVRLVTDTDAVAVDFAQLEDGAFPSSPIETAGTAVTRAADVVVATISQGYPATIYGEYLRSQLGPLGILFQTDDNVVSNRVILYLNTVNQIRGRIVATTDQMDNAVSGTDIVNTIQRAALRVQTNDGRAVRESILSAQDTSVNLPATTIRARFGTNASSAEPLFGYIRRTAIIPAALTDAQLQAITT
jgi:hypothetical protein